MKSWNSDTAYYNTCANIGWKKTLWHIYLNSHSIGYLSMMCQFFSRISYKQNIQFDYALIVVQSNDSSVLNRFVLFMLFGVRVQ